MDISDADDELDRLQDIDEDTVKGLAKVLFGAYFEVDAMVHVDTHSLKTSGVAHVENHPGEWEGTIEYGGAATGMPHDPVTYAEEERSRGGSHNYMRPAEDADDKFLDPIERFLNNEHV